MAYKTPGIYVEEVTTLSPSVVAVETAIPAFIGYTEIAVDDSGASGSTLRLVPTRIKSLLDYQRLFGGEFVPSTYQVMLDTTAGNAVGAVSPRNASGNERRYRLANSVRHYYANGGGPCYIVSVGSYGDAPALGNVTTPTGLLGGLSRVEPVDDPTLLVFPDAVALIVTDMGSLQMAALAQCEKLQDRFVIMDLCNGDQAVSLSLDPIADFRQNVGTGSLKYGAAYYPWVRTIYRPDVSFRQLSLVTPAAAPIAQAVIDTLTGDPAIDSLVPAVRNADLMVGTVVAAVNLSGMSGPNVLTLNRGNFAQLSHHFSALADQLRRLDAAAPDATVRQAFANLLMLPRAIAFGFRTLQLAPGSPATLSLAITQLSQDTGLAATLSALVAYEKNPGVMASVSAARAVADVITDYASLNGSPWILPNANVTAIAPSADVFTGPTLRETALNAAAGLRSLVDGPVAAMFRCSLQRPSCRTRPGTSSSPSTRCSATSSTRWCAPWCCCRPRARWRASARRSIAPAASGRRRPTSPWPTSAAWP